MLVITVAPVTLVMGQWVAGWVAQSVPVSQAVGVISQLALIHALPASTTSMEHPQHSVACTVHAASLIAAAEAVASRAALVRCMVGYPEVLAMVFLNGCNPVPPRV